MKRNIIKSCINGTIIRNESRTEQFKNFVKTMDAKIQAVQNNEFDLKNINTSVDEICRDLGI